MLALAPFGLVNSFPMQEYKDNAHQTVKTLYAPAQLLASTMSNYGFLLIINVEEALQLFT